MAWCRRYLSSILDIALWLCHVILDSLGQSGTRWTSRLYYRWTSLCEMEGGTNKKKRESEWVRRITFQYIWHLKGKSSYFCFGFLVIKIQWKQLESWMKLSLHRPTSQPKRLTMNSNQSVKKTSGNCWMMALFWLSSSTLLTKLYASIRSNELSTKRLF